MKMSEIVNGIFQKQQGVSLFQGSTETGAHEAETTCFMIAGTLTFDTVTEIWQQKANIFEAKGEIEVELSKVAHCDSAGVALLVALTREAKRHHRKISFSGVPAQMADIIQLSGLEGVLPL